MKWNCIVTEVNGHEFSADMRHRGAIQFAEFSFSAVAPEDRQLIAEGAPFEWTEGDSMVHFSHAKFTETILQRE